MIYQCGMYRKFDDAASSATLKIGLEFDWVYGYRLFKSLGDFTVEIADGGTGSMKLVDSTRSTSGSGSLSVVASAIVTLSAALALW